MAERVSLLDELRSGRYEAALATTFSIHFPFYEMVVHRKLLRSACLLQMVLVDSVQCAAALAIPELRPQLAGNSYVIVPVSAIGAFHPKVQLLLGKKGGKLLLGSHNLTFAGFGGNAEVTNLITIEPRDRASVAIARAAFDAIHTWVGNQPAAIEEYLRAAEESAPWLRGPIPTEGSDVFLWSAPGKTPSLWDQLRPYLRGPYSRVTVLGPYFDTELAFLHRLLEELRPAELVVGVDPRCSKMSVSQAKALKGVRFVDARGVLALLAHREGNSDDTESPPLHAKMLWIEGRDREVLVTGSANPSRPAWLDTDRNAEAVLVRIDPEEGVIDDLALPQLHDAPTISEMEWDLVSERAKDEWNGGSEGSRVAVAIADGTTILIQGVDNTAAIASVSLHTQEGGVFENQPWSRTDTGLTVTATTEMVEAAALVEIRGAEKYFAVVHHRPRLQARGGSKSLQRDLRAALGAMTADPSQLVNVLQIIENVISDEDGVRFRKGELRAGLSQTPPPVTPLESLAIGLDEVKRRRGRRKSIAERDLAAVLDLLVYRLGQDLGDEARSPPPEVEEKHLEGMEPEELSPVEAPVDGHAILRACQRKVKKVLTQMSRRLEMLDGSPEAAASVVARLAAVVGILRWLRRLDPTLAWLPFGESVIPMDACKEFFWEVAAHFATPKLSPIAVARMGLGDEPWQEAAFALGSLGWLGWECDIDRRELKLHPDEEEKWDYGLVSRLGWVMREVVLDEEALELLRETMTLVRRGRGDPAVWLREHEAWAEAIALLEFDPMGAPTLRRPAQRGDLVRLNMRDGRCEVGYVVSAEDRKVFVADPDHDEGRPVLREFATVLDWVRPVARPIATAAS